MSAMLTTLFTAVSNALLTESRVKLSVWNEQDYAACYQGSDLSPQKVAAVLKQPDFANQSSDSIKQAIAEKVKAYDEANGFMQFVWRWTQPIDAYQRLYTINRLYGLEAQLTKAEAEKKGDSKELRKLLLPILFDYQTSFISNYLKAGFFDGHRIYILNQQMNKIFSYLKQAYEDHYHSLMMDALLCKAEEIVQHEKKITAFFEEIEAEQKVLAEQYQKNSLIFFADIKERKALLAEILRLRKQQEVVASTLKPKEQAVISKVRKRWQHRLDYVNDHVNKDCRIQIGRGDRVLPNTYILEKSWWGSWRLYYYGNKRSKSQSIAIEPIPGLKEALQKSNRKEAAKLLSAWHQMHGTLAYTINPAQKHQAIRRLSSRNAAREMIGKHPLLSHMKLSTPSFQQSLTDYAKRLMAFGKEIVGWRESYDTQYQPIFKKIEEEKNNWDQALTELHKAHYQLQIEVAKKLFAKQKIEMEKRWDEEVKNLPSVNTLSILSKRQFEQEIKKEHTAFQQWLIKYKDINVPQGYSRSSHIKEIQKVFNDIEITEVMKAADPKAALRTIAENKASELLLKYIKEESDIEKSQSVYQEISSEIETCFTKLEDQSQPKAASAPSASVTTMVVSENATATANATPGVITTTTTSPRIANELTAMPSSDGPDVWESWLTKLKQKTPRSALGKIFHTAFMNLSEHNQVMKKPLLDSIEKMLEIADPQNKAEYEKNKAIALIRFDYLLKLSICLIELAKHGYFKEEREQIEDEVKKSLKTAYAMYIVVLHPDKWQNQLEGGGFDEINTLYQKRLGEMQEALNGSHCPAWLNSVSPNITTSEEAVVDILKKRHKAEQEKAERNFEAFIKEQREITDASLRRMDERLKVFIKEQREKRDAHIKEQREKRDAHIKGQTEVTDALLRRMDERLEVFIEEEREKKDAHIKGQREKRDAFIREESQEFEASLERKEERQRDFIEKSSKATAAIAEKHQEFDQELEEGKQSLQLLSASVNERGQRIEKMKREGEAFKQLREKKEEENDKMLAQILEGITSLKSPSSEPIATTTGDPLATDVAVTETLAQSPSAALFQHVHRSEYTAKPEPSTTPKKPGLSGSYDGTNNG